MGREVRRVPADWRHPKDERGRYIPLFGRSYTEDAARWDEGAAKWAEGLRSDYKGGWQPLGKYAGMPFGEWDGDRPELQDYMPDWPEAERTHWQMYEDTTEGTPISPVMETPEELARWLADTGASAFGGETASYEAWLATIRRGFAFSAVAGPGLPLTSGVAGMAVLENDED